MSEWSFSCISFFIILQDKSIRCWIGKLQRTFHCRLLSFFQYNLSIIIIKGTSFSSFTSRWIFQIKNICQNLVWVFEFLINSSYSVFASHCCNLRHCFCTEGVTYFCQAREKYRIHLARSVSMMNSQVGYWHKSWRKVLRCCNCALHTIGVDVYFIHTRYIICSK